MTQSTFGGRRLRERSPQAPHPMQYVSHIGRCSMQCVTITRIGWSLRVRIRGLGCRRDLAPSGKSRHGHAAMHRARCAWGDRDCVVGAPVLLSAPRPGVGSIGCVVNRRRHPASAQDEVQAGICGSWTKVAWGWLEEAKAGGEPGGWVEFVKIPSVWCKCFVRRAGRPGVPAAHVHGNGDQRIPFGHNMIRAPGVSLHLGHAQWCM